MAGRKKGTLEVHEHCIISGPNKTNIVGRDQVRHAGGDRPHSHPHTGPSSYTIDKDEWRRTTGLRGGGRKEFTTAPTGPQYDEMTYRTDDELSYDLIIVGPPHPTDAGPGIALPMRLKLGLGLRPRILEGKE